MKSLKSQIEKLHEEGKSFREIAQILNCSKGTISYHIGFGQKSKHNKRQQTTRQRNMEYFKTLYGGKCQCCAYDRSYNSLEFHHLDPNEKSRKISGKSIGLLMNTKGIKIAEEELRKCILLCANCHREVHDGSILIVEN